MQTVLDLMLADMEHADPLYRPTSFWESGLAAVLADLRDRGFDDFRSHPSASTFYAPRYALGVYSNREWFIRGVDRALGLAGRHRHVHRVRDMLAGRDTARHDYRVVRASALASGPQYWRVSESAIGQPLEQFEFDGVRYSRSSLNYLRGLHALNRVCSAEGLTSILEIGGGFGTLGELLLGAMPDALYVNVDIPPVAAISTYYLTGLVGPDRVLPYSESRTMTSIDLADLRERGIAAVVLCPWQLPRIEGSVDCFVNFISFQEMEPAIVANYAGLVQPLIRQFVLLRNSRHGKQVAAREGQLGVQQPVTMDWTASQFDRFGIRLRDHMAFGDHMPDGSFISEVAVLERQ